MFDCSAAYHIRTCFCVSEINRVRKDMYSDTVNGLVDRHPLELPEPIGPIVHLQEKLFVPVKEYPDVSSYGNRHGDDHVCVFLIFTDCAFSVFLQNVRINSCNRVTFREPVNTSAHIFSP